jgi:cytochrome c-type biogenesis protein
LADTSLIAAFFAGLLSFISPCVLPLVPGYLSFISGVTLDQLRGPGAAGSPSHGEAAAMTMALPRAAATRQVFFASLAFVCGFTVVFVSLGATASTLGAFLFQKSAIIGKVAGALLIIFGLHTMGVLKIPFLYTEKRFDTGNKKPAGFVGAFLVGLAFAFGWTPCIGPILSTILTLAADEGTLKRGIILLAVYSLGLGVPFLLTSLAVNQFFAAFAKIRRYYHAIEVTAGVMMIVIGGLIFTNRFTLITRLLQPYLPTF